MLISFKREGGGGERDGWEEEREREKKGGKERETEGGRENSNSKTLFYNDCSLGLVKKLTTSPC